MKKPKYEKPKNFDLSNTPKWVRQFKLSGAIFQQGNGQCRWMFKRHYKPGNWMGWLSTPKRRELLKNQHIIILSDSWNTVTVHERNYQKFKRVR